MSMDVKSVLWFETMQVSSCFARDTATCPQTIRDNPDSSDNPTKPGPESHSHWWLMHRQQITYCIQPMVQIKAATELCKLKCKAGLRSTLMKSHIKPNRESVCAEGNKREAKPTGSSASYLVPLSSFSPLSLPWPSLPLQFPPISLCDVLLPLFSCLSL